jgi:hypothetical protein
LALAVDGPSGTNGNDNRDSTDRSGESNSTKDVNSEDQKNFENTLNGDRTNNSNSQGDWEYCDPNKDYTTKQNLPNGGSITTIYDQNGNPRGTVTKGPNGPPLADGSPVNMVTLNPNRGYGHGTDVSDGNISDIGGVDYGLNSGGGDSSGGSGSGGLPFTSPGKEVDFHDLFRIYLQNSPTAQFATGLFAGGATGIAPGGFLADPFVDSLNYPQAFKIGYGLGQTTWGALEMLGGFGGHMLSFAFDASGIGAFAGIPGHVLSNAVGIEGAADFMLGYGVLRSAVSNKNAGGVDKTNGPKSTFKLPKTYKRAAGVEGKFSDTRYSYRLDTNKVASGEGGFHIHVYFKGKEIVKVSGNGRWVEQHGGKTMLKPSEVPNLLRTDVNRLIRNAQKNLGG